MYIVSVFIWTLAIIVHCYYIKYLTVAVAVEAVAKKLFEKLLNLLEDKVSITTHV